MTKQEIFTKVYETLRERGFTRARATINNTPICAYRGEVGPCAIGILMTDEEYSPAFEGMPGHMLAQHVAALGGYRTSAGLHFISELQIAHDNGATPTRMCENLNRFARTFNLEVPE